MINISYAIIKKVHLAKNLYHLGLIAINLNLVFMKEKKQWFPLISGSFLGIIKFQ